MIFRLHLAHGPCRYVEEIDVAGEVLIEMGLVLVNQLLARLQEWSWRPDARQVIGNVHHRIGGIFDPPELT